MPITRKQKAGSTIGGGLGGAATGATIGSVIPGIGTGIGALIGGGIGALGSYLGGDQTQQSAMKQQKKQSALNKVGQPNQQQGSFWNGTPAGLNTFNNLTPQQQELSNSLLQQGKQGLENYNKFDFAPIESAARQNFGKNTIPTLSERFEKLGGGSLNSSGFDRARASAQKDLELGLSAQKQNYNLQQQGQLQNLLQLGLSPQLESHYNQGSPGFSQNIQKDLAAYLSKAITTGIANPEMIQKALSQGSEGIKKLINYISENSAGTKQSDQDVMQQQYQPDQFQIPNIQSYGDIMRNNIANIGGNNQQSSMGQFQDPGKWNPYNLYSDTLRQKGYSF